MPPSVIVLIVWPVSLSPMIAVRIDSGIDVITMIMLRGDPRNSSTMIATRIAAVTASCTTSRSAARTNCDWSNVSITFNPLGAVARISGSFFLTASTTVSVEASACLTTSR